MLYNLLRIGTGPVPGLSETKEVQDTLKHVADLSENVGTARDETIKDLPEVFGLRFQHKYTSMNLSFNGLTGRDSIIVQTLRDCNRYMVNHVLLENEVTGIPDGMTGCECDYSGPRVPVGLDVHESNLTALKWVRGDNCDVDVSVIDLDEVVMSDGWGIIKNREAFEVHGGEYR